MNKCNKGQCPEDADPICGNDAQTYKNQCHLDQATCLYVPIKQINNYLLFLKPLNDKISIKKKMNNFYNITTAAATFFEQFFKKNYKLYTYGNSRIMEVERSQSLPKYRDKK